MTIKEDNQEQEQGSFDSKINSLLMPLIADSREKENESINNRLINFTERLKDLSPYSISKEWITREIKERYGINRADEKTNAFVKKLIDKNLIKIEPTIKEHTLVMPNYRRIKSQQVFNMLKIA